MAAAVGQSKRLASFTTPAGQDVFSLLKFEAREALSELFAYQVEATSTTANSTAEATYGTWNPTCSTSAAIVPKTPIMATANQYRHGS